LPGSEGLFSPQLSPDGRYVSAFPTDMSKLMLYDLKTEKWGEMGRGIFQFNTWSRDGKKIYLLYFDGVFKIVRFDVSSKRLEPVASLEDIEQGARGWIGLDEAENPLLVLDRSIKAKCSSLFRKNRPKGTLLKHAGIASCSAGLLEFSPSFLPVRASAAAHSPSLIQPGLKVGTASPQVESCPLGVIQWPRSEFLHCRLLQVRRDSGSLHLGKSEGGFYLKSVFFLPCRTQAKKKNSLEIPDSSGTREFTANLDVSWN
jgi:hypothetical protein